MRRVAAIWNRQTIPMEKGGAALGAAVAGAYAFFKSEGKEIDIEDFCLNLLRTGEVIQPRPEDVATIHQPGGYLDRFATEEARLIMAHPPQH